MYSILSGDIDLRDDVIKVMLLDSTFTPLATHNFVSEISSDELTGTGYVAGFGGSGRKTLASKTLVENDTDGVSIFDAADLTWTTITAGTAKYAAVIKEITNDAASPIIGYISFTERITAGGALTLAWSSSGIFRITAWAGEITNVRVVTYTATGGEGTDFTVTVSPAAASTDYKVFPASGGVTNVTIIDTPAADNTTSTFRVLAAAALTAGDIINFLLVE